MKISLHKELLYSRKCEAKNGYVKDEVKTTDGEKEINPDLSLNYIISMNSVEDLEKL